MQSADRPQIGIGMDNLGRTRFLDLSSLLIKRAILLRCVGVLRCIRFQAVIHAVHTSFEFPAALFIREASAHSVDTCDSSDQVT